MRDRGSDIESLDKLMKTKNIPEAHQDAFKTGFAEGFLKAQALTQKTNGKLTPSVFGEEYLKESHSPTFT